MRYLGHKGQATSDELLTLIDACVDECERLSRPKYVWRMFDIAQISYDKITFLDAEIVFPGKSIAAHLQSAATCVFLAATLGVDVDERIDVLQRDDMTHAVVIDACSSAAIEGVCDDAQTEIQAALANDRTLGRRFSPGYGDFPLDVQPALLNCLEAGKTIGLYCNRSNLLIPRKSVTVVLGVFAGEPYDGCSTKCAECDRADTCLYNDYVGRGAPDAPPA